MILDMRKSFLENSFFKKRIDEKMKNLGNWFMK